MSAEGSQPSYTYPRTRFKKITDMGNNNPKAPRAHAEDFLKQMQEENEVQKESTALESQIERLKEATKDANEACESLLQKIESARSYGVAVGKAIMLALDRVDGFETKLDGLKEFRFKAVLDDQSFEQITAEREALKEEHKKYLNEHKKTLNQLLEFEKAILDNHREELKKLQREHGAWISDKNFYWSLAIVVALIALFFLFGYLRARAKFT